MRIENGDLQKSWRQSYLFDRDRAGTNGEAKNFAKDKLPDSEFAEVL